MAIAQGLKDSLNAIREMSVKAGSVYHQYIPVIDDDTDIGVFADPILNVETVRNEFIPALINRIVYTSFEIKRFNNPLVVLEGDRIPLGYAGQEIYVNPAKGRRFNGEDFAGILKKYEADVKQQIMPLNMDVQYPLSISRQQLRTAMTSWEDLNTFVDQLSNSLYNGAFINEYRYTKNIVAGAYKDNKAVIEVVDGLITEQYAKDFITKARAMFLNFQAPSTSYNAWAKMGGYGEPITTWSNPDDIYFLIRNDIRSYIDVNVLASAFNISSTDLLGRIISVDNFDVYDDEGTKIFDGSNIIGGIFDRSWFRIKRQDMFLDTDYNPNNRVWQYYLNLIKMYNFSLFANGVIFATQAPVVAITSLVADTDAVALSAVGAKATVNLTKEPITATTAITWASADTDVFTVVPSADGMSAEVTAVGAGTANLTATAVTTAGNIVATVPVTVTIA